MSFLAEILAGGGALVVVGVFANALTSPPRRSTVGTITVTTTTADDSRDLELAAKLGPQLHPGDLFQVLDNQGEGGTWHAAAVGEGVLCKTTRHVSVVTLRWDYGTDRVDCPERACRDALGRL